MADGTVRGRRRSPALADPLERLLGYIDFRREILSGELPDYTCLLGTMVQETYATHPAIRDACAARDARAMRRRSRPDIAAAMAARGGGADWTAESLALPHPGGAAGGVRARQGDGRPGDRDESVDHLRRYLLLLLAPAPGACAA